MNVLLLVHRFDQIRVALNIYLHNLLALLCTVVLSLPHTGGTGGVF